MPLILIDDLSALSAAVFSVTGLLKRWVVNQSSYARLAKKPGNIGPSFENMNCISRSDAGFRVNLFFFITIVIVKYTDGFKFYNNVAYYLDVLNVLIMEVKNETQ